ncbi:hypothetical protein GQ457_14G011990 [Hibiscus cannabinus]
MEETSFTTAPPIFKGENYQTWAIRMIVHLQALDVSDVVEEDNGIPLRSANPTVAQMKIHREKKKMKAKVKSCIFSAVSPSILAKIMNFETPTKIWEHLKEKYAENEKMKSMKVINLLREFEMKKMKESDLVKECAEELVKIADKERMLGKKFSDEKIVEKILVTLPKNYEPKISSLENSKVLSSITLEELLTALQASETKRLMRKENFTEGAFQAHRY